MELNHRSARVSHNDGHFFLNSHIHILMSDFTYIFSFYICRKSIITLYPIVNFLLDIQLYTIYTIDLFKIQKQIVLCIKKS